MTSIANACCFSGHRPKHFHFGTDESHPDCLAIKAILRERSEYLINQRNVTHFISGGSLGVDTWAMEVVLSLKEKYPQVTLECALPYPTMPDRFAHEHRMRYDALAEKCDRIVAVCPEYTGVACLDARDEYMVDRAGFLIAIWQGIMSGTGRTIFYARRLGREVFCFYPRNTNEE